MYIGIDGGGTHSTGVLCDGAGRVLARREGGGMNFHTRGMDAVRDEIHELTEALLRDAGVSAGKVCLGLAALDAPAEKPVLEELITDPLKREEVRMVSDTAIALWGLTRGGSGMIMICGTGSMMEAMDDAGRTWVRGGWGYRLGDPLSGYSLAVGGLRAVFRAEEHLGPQTSLRASALSAFSAENPRKMLDALYAPECTPARLALFAEAVTEAARAGDPAAVQVVEGEIGEMAEAAGVFLREVPGIRRVGLHGGIFAHNPWIRTAMADRLREGFPDLCVDVPEAPPEIGAVWMRMAEEHALTDRVAEETIRSYKEWMKT